MPGIGPDRPPGRLFLPAHTSPCLRPEKPPCAHPGASPVRTSSRSTRLKAWTRHGYPDPCLLSPDGQGLPLPLPFTIPASAPARVGSTWTMPSAAQASQPFRHRLSVEGFRAGRRRCQRMRGGRPGPDPRPLSTRGEADNPQPVCLPGRIGSQLVGSTWARNFFRCTGKFKAVPDRVGTLRLEPDPAGVNLL